MFDSGLEETRYRELTILQNIGDIEQLKLHPKFDIYVRNIKVTTYTPDIQYFIPEQKLWVIEECKGYFHKADRLRFKIFVAHMYEKKRCHVYLQDSQFYNGEFFKVRLTDKGTLQGEYINGWKRWKFQNKKVKPPRFPSPYRTK